MMTVKDAWTIVQHSGYGYKHNPQFKQAVETRKLTSVREMKTVERVGGCLFDSYLDAEKFAEHANYPPGHKGLIPNARGTFSNLMIDQLKIYIPVRAEPIG